MKYSVEQGLKEFGRLLSTEFQKYMFLEKKMRGINRSEGYTSDVGSGHIRWRGGGTLMGRQMTVDGR